MSLQLAEETRRTIGESGGEERHARRGEATSTRFNLPASPPLIPKHAWPGEHAVGNHPLRQAHA